MVSTGPLLHPVDHALGAVAPKTRRHNAYEHGGTSWAGGGARGAGAVARARERLRERTGL